MIVYRDQRSRADPRRLLSDLQSCIRRAEAADPSHQQVVGILIDSGILESAVADALFPEQDNSNPIAEGFRRLSLAAAHLLWHSWHRNPDAMAFWYCRLSKAADAAAGHALPRIVETTPPEGYFHYSLYPEMYLEAAKSFVTALGRVSAIVLGIRSIGSSLSAVVAASLQELGCQVESFTLRPRGHPFSRSPRMADGLAALFASRAAGHFLVVDEGPGLSGSSLGGTAGWLHELGIADDHIHLFPAWRADGSRLRSSVARERWTRHLQFTRDFEEIWLGSGRLQEVFPGTLSDLSGGKWRTQLLGDGHPYPAVQPQHERRKYLLASEESGGPTKKLLSFAGLGAAAERKVVRLAELAEAGFTPAPERLAYGFMQRPFLPGTPARPGSGSRELLDFVAAYLAHLDGHHPADNITPSSCVEEMVRVNVAEGLRSTALEKQVERLPREAWAERPIALDGRMLAHEWIATPAGYLKVDAMDHHDDHFFPGATDIAWDLAAACMELELGAVDRNYLVSRYRRLSSDRTIGHRLHPHATAYLAFRLGYATLAAETLGDSEDGQRFAAEQCRYHDLLVRELSDPRAIWDG